MGRCRLGQFWGKIKKVFSGINLLYENVSNGTNCNLDPAIFDPLPWKIFQNKRRPLNFAAHGKLDLRPKIIHFFLKLALEVKKVVGCGSKIWSWATLFRANFFWKKPVFWAIGVSWVSKNYRLQICFWKQILANKYKKTKVLSTHRFWFNSLLLTRTKVSNQNFSHV